MSDADSKQSSGGYYWLILALAFISFIMSFTSRYVWPPLMPIVMPVLGITLTQGMFYMTAFFFGYVFMQIPGGILSDRFGPRRILATTLLVQGICTCLLSLTESYQFGLFLRVATGLAGGSVYSSCFKAVVSWMPAEKRSLAVGVLLAAPSIGVSVPNIVAPKLNALLGWQNSFLIVGMAIIVVGLLVYVLMRDAKIHAAGEKPHFMVGVRFVLSSHNMRFIALADFWIIFIQLGFYSLGNAYMVDRLLSINPDLGHTQAAVQAGLVMFYVGIVGVVMPAFAGWLSGVTDRPTWIFMGGALLLIPAFLAFGAAQTYSMWMVCGVAVGALLAFVNPMFSVVIAENAGPQWAATAGGIGNCWLQFGGMLGPVVMGLAREWTGAYTACWGILSAMALVATVLCFFVRKPPSDAERDALIAKAASDFATSRARKVSGLDKTAVNGSLRSSS